MNPVYLPDYAGLLNGMYSGGIVFQTQRAADAFRYGALYVLGFEDGPARVGRICPNAIVHHEYAGPPFTRVFRRSG